MGDNEANHMSKSSFHRDRKYTYLNRDVMKVVQISILADVAPGSHHDALRRSGRGRALVCGVIVIPKTCHCGLYE